jgi:hypothetical protein
MESHGAIKRLVRGVYAKPEYSEFLQETVDPNPHEVIAAIARANRWTVVPSGETALNAIGLSEQVPAKYEYVSNGPYKRYDYNGYEIHLLHRAERDFYDDPTLSRVMLIIQALKALGKDAVDGEVVDTLNKRLSDDDIAAFYENTKYGISWIFEVAKKLKEGRANE